MARTKTKRKSSAAKKPIRARVTKPDKDVGQNTGGGAEQARLEFALWEAGLFQDYKDQVYVNDYTAMNYAVVWRCLVYIAQTIASLGWHVFQSTPGKPGKERIYPYEDDVAWLLDTQASPEMSAFDFRHVLVMDMLKTGNGFGEIDRDGFGRPRWLWYICYDRVKLKRNGSGSLYYEIDNGLTQPPTIIPPENMFHLKGPSPDGLWGYSVIALARSCIRLGLQMEKYGDTFFGRGPMPGGILEIQGNPKKEERDAMRESFQKTYGGSKNAGRVVVTSGGVKFNPLSLPNDDAQFIESRKFGITEICRWFGVPPHKAFDLERATFTNIEHQSIEAVQDCHLPIARRLETEADLKLFGRVNRGRRWTRLNLNTLLRGDSKTQTENLVSQVNAGLKTFDEARDQLDLNPYPDDLGAEPFVQSGMIPVDTALNPPEPPQPAAAPAQDGGDQPQEGDKPAQNGQMPKQMAAAFGTLLASEYAKWLRVETDKAKRADNKGKLGDYRANYYTLENRRERAQTIRPVIEALLLACGHPADSADDFAADFADDHATRSVRDLASGDWADEWANGRAEDQAKAHLAEVWGVIRT